MIDSVNNSPMSTLLRAQTTSQSAGTTALKTNKEATQTIISQLQESLSSTQTSPTSTIATGNNATLSNLPRGSLVNILV